jgi:predicted kinase
MCGLAFSGKTTLAYEISRFAGATYIGLDDINRERGLPHGGEGLPVEEWERTHRLAVQRVERLMREGAPIIVDDTSNHRFLRERFRGLAEANGYPLVLVFVDTPLGVIRRRMDANAACQQRAAIRDHVFDEHVRTFELPGPDENAVVFTPGQPVGKWLEGTLTPRARSVWGAQTRSSCKAADPSCAEITGAQVG